MRSSELARLAGVTVRALRHYHQLGILDEPHRAANGYREYTVHHLVRVLRISRLSSLGVSLTELKPVLDADAANASELLDRLDAETAAKIDRLTARRELIGRLKEWNAAPDLPDQLARHVALFAAHMGDSTLARFDREQAILVSHLLGADGADAVSAVYARFSEPELLEASVALTRRLEQLDADAPDSAVDAIVSDIITTFEPVMRELRADETEGADAAAISLLTEYASDVLNPAQQQVLDRVDAILSAPPGQR